MPSIATSTSSPALAVPVKLTVVLRRVRPRRSARVGPARPLDEHLLDPSDPLGIALGRDALDDLDQPLEPLVLHGLGHLVGHRRRVGARAAASR